MPDASCLVPEQDFFTGKPSVEGLGYSFLFRNYRADVGKWQTSDPLGYPDGWNNFAYCNNSVTDCFDYLGAWGIQFGEINIGYGDPWLAFDQDVADTYSSATIGTLDGLTFGGFSSLVGTTATDQSAYDSGLMGGSIAQVALISAAIPTYLPEAGLSAGGALGYAVLGYTTSFISGADYQQALWGATGMQISTATANLAVNSPVIPDSFNALAVALSNTLVNQSSSFLTQGDLSSFDATRAFLSGYLAGQLGSINWQSGEIQFMATGFGALVESLHHLTTQKLQELAE
jgi:RHS repeat-associated protein